MPKAEWGKKVVCLNCETKFYDLNRKPIICPSCGTEFIDPAIDAVLTNAKQVMIAAVRDTLDSFSTCPSCDELTETFVDFIPEGLRDEMLLQRRDPESFWYKGDKND